MLQKYLMKNKNISFILGDVPDILVFPDVYFVELPLHRRHDVQLHLPRHVLRQHRLQQPLLGNSQACRQISR